MFGSTWLAVWVVCCATLIAGLPAVPDDTNEFALNWLRSYGYLYTSKSDDELGIADVSAAVRRMQAFASLPETGEVDADTLEVMKMPRCGVPDFQPHEDSQLMKYRPKWYKTALTYKFESYSADLYQYQQRATVAAAFKQWSDVCQLSFTREYVTADIIIKSAEGEHGVVNGNVDKFDGKGGVLAHAYFPGPGVGGDLHYDDAETFRMHSTDSDDIDLLYVSVHEIGHSLGLEHTNNKDAIMYPQYKKLYTVKLTSYDIRAIQYLYGQ